MPVNMLWYDIWVWMNSTFRVLYTVIVKKLYMHFPFFVNPKTENIWTYLELQVNVTNVHTITPIRPVLHNFIIYNIALTS